LRLLFGFLVSVMSDAVEKVPTGGELTLFEVVGPVGLAVLAAVSLVAGRGCPA
jgi:hypothetical protein